MAVREKERRKEMRKEVSLALSGMSSRDYVSQDSINLSTSSLFKGGGDFSLPQVSRRVVGKDSNPLSPLSSPRSPRVRRAPSPISSSSVFAFHPVAPCKQPRLPMTRRINWKLADLDGDGGAKSTNLQSRQ